MSRADTREPRMRTEPLKRAGWEVTVLKYGDYDGYDAVGKLWAVEHKTLSKMIGDMKTGTLMRQCRSLVEHSAFPILLVEGHWTQNKDGYLYNHQEAKWSSVTWQQAWNELETIQDIGCRLQLTTSMVHTIQRLFEIEAYYQKEKHDSALRQLSGNPYITVLSLIDGIDEKKAKTLEVVYPTLGDLAQATFDDLQEVKGIGGILAKRIWTFLRTDWRTKLNN